MFTMPESLDGLSLDDLTKLYDEAMSESLPLVSKNDADLSDDEAARLIALSEALTTIDERRDVLKGEAQERTDKLAAARGKVADAQASTVDPEPEPEGDDDEDEESDDDADDDAAADKEKELVTASASRTVRKARENAPDPVDVVPTPVGSTLIAAANLPSVSANDEFTDMTHAAKVFGQRAAKGPAAGSSFMVENGAQYGLSDHHTRLGFAKIKKPAMEFALTTGMTAADQMAMIDRAADEKRLAGGSLIAAGGWCSPSETVYDFCSFETVTGILDLPTIDLSRGGLIYSKGPDYAAIAASWGFMQTEAQAEAGTAKVCYAVECPPFTEVRLDVIGFCITAGILTNATYPELIRRVLEIGAVAHAHKVNAYVIGKLSTLIGAAVDFAEVGSATADLLDALALAGDRLRYSYSMDPKATLEVVLPFWAKRIIQSDLSRRNGVDLLAVSDADISRYLAARNIRVQFVYDYQNLTSASTDTWTSWPDSLEFMIYPAGAFVKGTTDVIDLDTIYDSVNTSTNTYTAAFFEEGVQVFNRCGSGLKYTVDISCLAGVTGAAELTCVAP